MIETTTNKLTFLVGNDPVFAFPIPFFNKTDIHCYITNSDGILFELENGSQFSVEDREDYTEGALITLLDNHFSGSKLTISRVMIITQDISLPQYGKIPSPSLERQLDKTIMICQQLREMLSRVVLVPPGLDATWEDLMNLLTSAGQDAQEAAQRAQEILDLLEGMGIENLAPLDSPHFVGMPTAPTAGKGTNTDQLATTKFVQNEVADFLTRNKSSFTASQWILDQSAGTYYYRIVTDAQDVSHVYKLETGGAMVMDDTVEIHIMDEGYIKLVAASGFDGFLLTLESRLPVTFSYTLSGDSLSLTGVLSNPGNLTDLSIPSSAEFNGETVPVVSIAANAFNGSRITSIAIGNGIEKIDTSAFQNTKQLHRIELPQTLREIGTTAFYLSSITEINIPEGVEKIGSGAFRSTELESLYIPATVKTIGGAPSSACSSLTEITVAEENQYFSSQDGVLFDKGKTRLIQYPAGNERSSYTVPDGVKIIGQMSFNLCKNLNSLVLPDSLTVLETESLAYCSISTLIIPVNVYSIGGSALGNISTLTEITVATGNQYFSAQDGVLFDNGKTQLIAYPAGNARTSYNIPAGVTEIGAGSLRGVTKLKSITIPESCSKIGSNAFYSCGIEQINIPASVIEIGTGALSATASLETITVAAGNQYFSAQDGVLFNKGKTRLIQYPAGNERTSYTIPDGVTEIASQAFFFCNLTSVVFPSGLQVIEGNTFNSATKITSLDFPASVNNIGQTAFHGCSELTEITFRNPGTWSMENPFTSCPKLFTVYGYPGSTAEEFASRYNYLFKSLED